MALILQQGKEVSTGHTKEVHSLPFGHGAKAAEDIDGLVVSCDAEKFTHFLTAPSRQLLEDHLKDIRPESLENNAGDEQGWDNWLVESDSDPPSDESDWINVVSDGSNDLEISDSESEIADGEPDLAAPDQHEHPLARRSSLATTKVYIKTVPIQNSADVSVRYLRRLILP